MSKWTDAVITAMSLTSAASEEASRAGSSDIDLEHLFLALVLSGGEAGDLLRAHDITIERARAAIEEVRAAQVATLGIDVPAVTPRPLQPAYDTQLDFSPRARDVLKKAPTPYDATSTLRALLGEPSGTIATLLEHLDVDVDSLQAKLSLAAPSSSSGGKEVTATGFITAPVEEVWAMISDPTRLPEWNRGTVVSVVPEPAGTWLVTDQKVSGARGAGGKTIQRRIAQLEVDAGAHRLVEEATWLRSKSTVIVTITLRPADGDGRAASSSGTRIDVAGRWASRRPGKIFLRRLLGPLARFTLSSKLSLDIAALSRHYR